MSSTHDGAPLAVVAVGGNALARRGEPLDWATQLANAQRAAAALAPVLDTSRVVITHGNGPQVGMLALGADAAAAAIGGGGGASAPLDVLDAETEGMIGYLLTQELANAAPSAEFAAVVTRVVVDPDDPAFDAASKPVGPVYDETTATDLALHRGWRVARDGPYWRRVVASPEPRSVVELRAIRTLVDAGIVVVCGGGGGVPVAHDGTGRLRGVEAVIDKDLASTVLAVALGADRLVLLTDVEGVVDGWGGPAAALIERATVAEMRRRSFAAGSMGPKVEAACRFVERTGRTASIGALEQAAAVVAGTAGTTVVP